MKFGQSVAASMFLLCCYYGPHDHYSQCALVAFWQFPQFLAMSPHPSNSHMPDGWDGMGRGARREGEREGGRERERERKKDFQCSLPASHKKIQQGSQQEVAPAHTDFGLINNKTV